MRQFTGKRVLVTGGAQGIGLAIGRRFAAEGAEVLLSDLEEGLLERARKELPGAKTFVCDVTDDNAVERLADGVGPIDVLVNNAGVVFGGPFLETPMERHRITLEVNLVGLVRVTHAFLEGMLSRPEGHIVNIASASGFVGLPNGTTYAASKWAVIGFSQSLRQELEMQRNDRVGVTTICPSYVTTGLFEGVKPPLLTRWLTPDELADRTIKAVRRKRPFLLTPWLVKLAPALTALLPTRMADGVGGMLGVTTSMMKWRGRT